MTAKDLRKRLIDRYPLPEWCLLFEVANAVGNMSKRYADAVAMCLTPSRGLALHGFEIKISRQDLKTELAEAAKADAVGRYCDYWWVVTPEGLCGADELPLNWGLLESKGDILRERKPAIRVEPQDYDRAFVAALARRIGRLDAETVNELVDIQLKPVKRRIELLEQEMEEEIARRTHAYRLEAERMRQEIVSFERMTGLKFSKPADMAGLVNLAALIQKNGAFKADGLLDMLESSLTKTSETIQDLKMQVNALSQPERDLS